MNNVLAAQPGEYIKGNVVANVSGAKALSSKSGKTFWKATLSEGGVKVNVTSFSKTFEHVDGKRAEFSGQGIKRGDDYNGVIQLTFGDKVVFKPVGEATPTQPTPAAEEPRKTQGTASNGPSSHQHATNGRIEGVTVGMAINKAVDILIAEYAPQGGEKEWRTFGAEEVWQKASMLIRVAQELQSGNLAPVTATNDVPSEEVPF
jgi:hypothetical protein